MLGLRERLDQACGGTAIGLLAGAEFEPDQMSKAVGNSMDFGRPAAAAAANFLGVGPPFPPALQRWALALVLSMLCMSAALNVLSVSNMDCQMPALDHRLNRL
jgi:hypothetical protein